MDFGNSHSPVTSNKKNHTITKTSFYQALNENHVRTIPQFFDCLKLVNPIPVASKPPSAAMICPLI